MYNMTIRLQADGDRCLYEQIYEHIRQEIREGKLLAEERLPSTRSLAEYLQVSRSTVDLAYSQLLSEGYIEARPWVGYYVCRVEELFRLAAAPGRVPGKAPEKVSEAETEQGSILPEERAAAFAAEEKIQYDFSPNGMDMNAFPFSVWKRISNNVLRDQSRDLFSAETVPGQFSGNGQSIAHGQLIAHGHAQGDPELRETIGRYLHSSRGVNCRPEQIIVGAGNDYLLMLLEKILGRNVKIAMESPTYKRAYQIFCSFSYPIVTIPMDENGMVVSGLEKTDVTAAYVMPSHQYPAGIVMPIGRRTELLRWAEQQEGRYLIEDDYDSEFRYHGKPIPSLQASDRQGRVIYMGTFSKAIAPAIRVGYMVLPEQLLERYRQVCSFYSSTVSRIDQRIINEFIKDGYFERHLNKMRKIYRSKHDLLLEELEPFRDDFRISGENAGLHLLLTGKKGQKEKELIRKAADYEVKVYGLSDYYIIPWECTSPWECASSEGGEREQHTVLLGYGGLGMKQIKEGIDRLKRAWF